MAPLVTLNNLHPCAISGRLPVSARESSLRIRFQSVVTTQLTIPTWLDLLAVTANALFGALIAVKARFDTAGILALGILTGVGGGILRDILLNQVPTSISNPWFIVAALISAIFVALVARWLSRLAVLLLICDAAALSLFGVTGAKKALANGVSPLPAIFIGLIAGLGGGIICDMMTTKPPKIFKRGHLKAPSAFVGLFLYVIAIHFGAPANATGAAAILIIFGLRVINRDNDWNDSANPPAAQPAAAPAAIPKQRAPD